MESVFDCAFLPLLASGWGGWNAGRSLELPRTLEEGPEMQSMQRVLSLTAAVLGLALPLCAQVGPLDYVSSWSLDEGMGGVAHDAGPHSLDGVFFVKKQQTKVSVHPRSSILDRRYLLLLIFDQKKLAVRAHVNDFIICPEAL